MFDRFITHFLKLFFGGFPLPSLEAADMRQEGGEGVGEQGNHIQAGMEPQYPQYSEKTVKKKMI